jgi:hypothetical protein
MSVCSFTPLCCHFNFQVLRASQLFSDTKKSHFRSFTQCTFAMAALMYFPSTTLTRLFLLVAVLQGVFAIGLEGLVLFHNHFLFYNSLMTSYSYVFVTVQNDLDPAAFQVLHGRTVPMYLSLFIFAFVYELVSVYDALRLNSMIQVVGLCIYNILLLIYAALQPLHVEEALDLLSTSLALSIRPILPPDLDTWQRVRPVLLAVIVVQAVATAALIYLAFKLHSEIAWHVYKVVHADLSMKRRLLNFQVGLCLLICLCPMPRKI